MLAINSEHRLRQENLPFDIDVWYPSVSEFTPKSVFVPINKKQAIAIVGHYRSWIGISSKVRVETPFGEEEMCTLIQLEAKIQTKIENFFGTSPVFMRLCGRSPKDSIIDAGRDKYNEILAQCNNDENGAIQKITSNNMKIESASKLMRLLLTSERVYADLIDYLEYGEPEQICLREFFPCEMGREFRVFICHDNITAISQYDHYGFYPYLKEMKERAQESIEKTWKQVHERLQISSYIADFYYDDKKNASVLIELSPFRTCTGTALFKWTRDREVLTGKKPFEFRIREEPLKSMPDMVDAWKYSVFEARAPPVPYFEIGVWSKLWLSWKRYLFSDIWGSLMNSEDTHYMFVYGTLKRGFHWNSKYMSECTFVCNAKTLDAVPLFVGESGVPYLYAHESGKGLNVCGEIWAVHSKDQLKALDDYEGVGKGHYVRVDIDVIDESGKLWKNVQVYSPNPKFANAFEMDQECLSNYSYSMHKSKYKPILHIEVKQRLYTKGELNEIDNELLMHTNN